MAGDASGEEKEINLQRGFEIGYVDPSNPPDVDALRQILRSPGVRRWIEDIPKTILGRPRGNRTPNDGFGDHRYTIYLSA